MFDCRQFMILYLLDSSTFHLELGALEKEVDNNSNYCQ